MRCGGTHEILLSHSHSRRAKGKVFHKPLFFSLVIFYPGFSSGEPSSMLIREDGKSGRAAGSQELATWRGRGLPARWALERVGRLVRRGGAQKGRGSAFGKRFSPFADQWLGHFRAIAA